MENPLSWTKAEWIVQDAIDKAYAAHEEGLVGLSMTRRITDALREEGLLSKDLPPLGVFKYDVRG